VPLRVVLPPLVTAYAIFVAMVLLAWRRPAPRPGGLHRGTARAGRSHAAATMLGGYAAFLLVVLVFHVWIADEPAALASALWGGAFLCGVALVFTTGSALMRRSRGRAG
jgi:hypothetical protein